MQTKQYLKLSHNSLKVSSVARLLAVGAIASGAAAFSAVPASAASFSGGQLAFSDGTSDFFSQLNATAVGDSFTVNFNPGSFALINSNTLTVPSGTNTASSLISTPTFNPAIAGSTGTFSRTSASTFTLANALSFAFGSGTSVNFAPGNVLSLDVSNTATVGLSLTNGLGTIVNGADSTVSNTLGIQLQDGFTTGGGNYSVVASPTAIPEPFTIIGTLVGGTAALRMRKKLSDASKH